MVPLLKVQLHCQPQQYRQLMVVSKMKHLVPIVFMIMVEDEIILALVLAGSLKILQILGWFSFVKHSRA